MANDAVVGSVSVEVVPSTETFWSDFKAKTRPGAVDAGKSVGADLGDAAGAEVRRRINFALNDLSGRVNLKTDGAEAEIEKLRLEIDTLGDGPGGGGKDIGGIGSGASGAASSVSGALIPALVAAAAVLAGPLIATGAAAFGTIALGAQGLQDDVKNGLTPEFKNLQASATAALGPGVLGAIDQLKEALPQLNPLINVVGTEVGNVAEQFASWLNHGGIADFTKYAEKELPIVEGALESLAKASIEFFSDVTPLANGLLEALKGIADAYSKISGFLGGASDTLNGPAKAVQASQQSGGSGFNFGHASSTSDYFSSIAQDFVGLFTVGGANHAGPSKAQQSTSQFNNINPQAANTLSTADQATLASTTALNAQAAALGLSVDAYNTAVDGSKKFADQTASSTAAMQLQNDAAGLLSQSLQQIGGNTLGVAEANTRFQTSLSTLTATLHDNKDAIDGTSDAALANQAALQQQVEAAQAVYDATAKQTGSTVQAKAAYDAAIQSIKDHLKATGDDTAQIDAYITQLAQIPPVKSTKIDIDNAAALAALAQVRAAIPGAVDAAGSPLNITVNGRVKGSANGNIFKAFASGGENHVAQIAPAGAMRLWAEPETGGEAYIPLAASKRARSTAILGDVASQFGLSLGSGTGGAPIVVQSTLYLDGRPAATAINQANMVKDLAN